MQLEVYVEAIKVRRHGTEEEEEEEDEGEMTTYCGRFIVTCRLLWSITAYSSRP